MEICLTKLANENKEVYICGDFNFDLLKTETNHLTQYFFNLLCSYGFLPHILQPTRVAENTATVIEEIIDIIKSLENKSTGPYSIPLKMLAVIPDFIIIPLANIINMSFRTGEYPELLKVVKVVPIHKGGSAQDINNYRPISLLSIFDKIVEKLMHKKLYYFLEEHIILYQNQFGFRRNNSTVHALTQITEMIKDTIDSGKFGCGIFVDLRKAFDTVNHEILLSKLEHWDKR